MPELPEVESLRRALARSILGRTIVSTRINEPRLRRVVSPDFPAAVSGRKIEGLRRRAKYLIVDLSGATIEAPRVQGEILVRGPNVTPGYWGMPEATALAIDKDGWFRTGDAGFFDEEGFLTISDRIKDMIITGGENVYPAEVESALMRHPAIAEVAVIGEPDEQWGEGVVAIAALKAGRSLRIDELRDFAGGELARFKLPRRLEIVAALPRNATGKILKYQLRQRIAKPRAARSRERGCG